MSEVAQDTRSWARQLCAVIAAAAMLFTAACAAGSDATEAPPPRPVTVAESELLASVRFHNFDAGSRAIVATYTDQGHDVELEGWFDYTTHTGYALLSVDGLPSDRVTWDGRIVATTAGTQLGTPLRSLDGWQAAALDPRGSPLAVVLAVLSGLGADRPENPLLIRQGGALWLREDTTGGRPVTVFAGPSKDADQDEPDQEASGGDGHQDGSTPVDPESSGMRYWVDDTGLAHRVDIRLGDRWAEVTLTNDDVRVPALLAGVDPRTVGIDDTGAAPADGGKPDSGDLGDGKPGGGEPDGR